MKEYVAKQALIFPDALYLLLGSIIIGFGGGFLGFCISYFLYIPIVFPLVLSFIVILCFQKMREYVKVPHRAYIFFCSVLMTITIVLVYHYISYNSDIGEAVNEMTTQYNITSQDAHTYIDEYTKSKTGFTGILGSLILTSQEGENHTLSHMYYGVELGLIHYQLKGIVYWISLFVQTIIILIIVPLLALQEKSLYNFQKRDIYSPTPKLIGIVPLDVSQKFLSYLKTDKLQEARKLLVNPEKIVHPVWEVKAYPLEKFPDSYKLLEVVQTRRTNSTTVKREVIFRSEIDQVQYSYLLHTIRS